MATRVEEIKLSLIDGVSKELQTVEKTVEGVSGALDTLNKSADGAQTEVDAAAKALTDLEKASKESQAQVDEFNKSLRSQIERLREQTAQAQGGAAGLAEYRLAQLETNGATEDQIKAARELVAQLRDQEAALEAARKAQRDAAKAAEDQAKAAEAAARDIAKQEQAQREAAAAALTARTAIDDYTDSLADQVRRLREQEVQIRRGTVGLAEYRLEQLKQSGATETQIRAAEELIGVLRDQEAAVEAAKKEIRDAAKAAEDQAKAAADAAKENERLARAAKEAEEAERNARTEIQDFTDAIERQIQSLKEQAAQVKGGAAGLAEYRLQQLSQAGATEAQRQEAQRLVTALRAQEDALEATKRETREAADAAKLARTSLEQIRDSVAGLGASLVKLNAGFQLAQTGFQAVTGVAGAAGRAFDAFVTGASKAEFQLAGLQAALGATPEELAKLDAEARRVSESLGLFSKTEVLDALGGLGRAGLNAEQALAALVPVINLATAGQVDLQFATDQTVNTLTQFGLGIEQAGALANGLVTAANASTTNVNALGLALSYAATSSRAAGNTLEETLEILAALAQTGLQGERAGTALRATFAALADEGSKFSASLRNTYGITTTNLLQVIEQLRSSTDRGKAAFQALGVEAGPAIQGLVALAVPQFNQLRDAVTGSGTAAEDATTKLTDTYQAALGRITNILSNLRNELAAPILEPLADVFESLGKRLTELARSEDWKALGQAVADFARDASERIIQFIKDFDFTDAVESARAQFVSLKANLDEIAASLSVIAATLQATVDAVQIGASAISTAFNGIVTALATALERIVAADIAFRKFLGENTDAAEGLRASLQRIAEVRFERTGESAAKLVGAIEDLEPAADGAEQSVSGLARGLARADDSAVGAADAFGELARQVRSAETAEEIDRITESAIRLAAKTDDSGDGIRRFEKALAGAESELRGTAKSGGEAAEAIADVGASASDLEDSGVQTLETLGTAAENAAADTKRLAQAFRDANAAGQFDGALDQFERLKAEGNLTEEQIKEIAKAAEEAGKKFQESGDDGEDSFDRIADSAERAAKEIERSADAAEQQASSLESIFAVINRQAEESAQRNADIQEQIQAQVEAANDSVEKQIELLQRRLNLSREELAIADQLRQKYKLAEQEQLDRLAQLIARQREMNKEKAEELRIVIATTSAGAPGGGTGGTGGVNGRPVGTGRPRDTIQPDESGDGGGAVSVPDSQLLRNLARILAPELRRIQSLGG